jgi:peptide-methionine (R)-S-oxide reductase
MLNWTDVLAYADEGNPTPPRRVEKSDEAWKTALTAEQYRVTRQAGTERAFSSDMCSILEPGVYHCVCCDIPLFDSGTKFESGTGWPSFTQPMTVEAVAYNSDRSYGMVRVETVCNVCDAHLGHVFPDGPQEAGGLRFCINAAALRKAGD